MPKSSAEPGTADVAVTADDFGTIAAVTDLEPLARERMSPMAWAYLSGGNADELTLRWNRERFDAIRLEPRVLVDASTIDTRLRLLGHELAFPILLAPVGFQRLFHPEGELASACGAGEAGAVYVASTAATTSITDVGRAASGPLWFQLYVQKDRGYTRELIRKAEDAGASAVCLTVDTPTLGSRDRERRAGMHLPPPLRMENLLGLATAEQQGAPFHADLYNPFLDASLTWKDVTWVRSVARVPVLLKGILSPDDARCAVEEGVAAIVVSNHGGRNLDTVPATIDVLPRVAEVAGGRVPLLMDGGIRRGTDVLKALALGASAVLVGRPYVWGLAAYGAKGVRRVVEILRRELALAMAMSGVPSLDRITRRALWER